MYQQGKSKVFNPFPWLVAGDLVAIGISFCLPILIAHPATTPTIPEYCLYALLLLANCRLMKLYTWGAFTLPLRLLTRLAAALVLSSFYFVALRCIFQENNQFDQIMAALHEAGRDTAHWLKTLHVQSDNGIREWICLQLITALLFLMVIRRLIFSTAKKMAPHLTIERVAFVGWSPNLNSVLKALARQKRAFLGVEGFFFTTRDAAMSAALHGHRSLGELSALEENLQKLQITMLMVDPVDISNAELRQIAEITARNLVSLEIIQSTFDIWATYLGIRVMGGVPVVGLVSRMRHEQVINRILKRILDVACALFGLTVSAPVIAVMAVLIYLESPGPVFYRQTRLGLGGKEFEIIKLRSMKLNADNVPGGGWTVKNDPRRLRIGKLLREWNLDELPQFWNVLKGEMSMVGPRPERPGLVNNFKHEIRYYNLRLACKCGLTGWAAVHGLRGDTSIEDRLAYDLYYIENWSIWLDIKIMFMTLLPPENAY